MATTLAQRLENRAAALVAEAKNHPLAQLVLSEATDEPTLLAAIRGVLLRVHYYGRSLTRSIFHAIGRIVTSDPDAARWLVELEFDEAPHPGMAFRDYVKMGGDPAIEQEARHSPAAYVVAATVDMLARSENPYAFLGALHLLESTTPAIIEAISPALRVRPLVQSVEFLSLHRTQDLDHTATLCRLIDDITARDEEARQAIEFGHACFAIVYPRLIWTEVLAEVNPGPPNLGPQQDG